MKVYVKNAHEARKYLKEKLGVKKLPLKIKVKSTYLWGEAFYRILMEDRRIIGFQGSPGKWGYIYRPGAEFNEIEKQMIDLVINTIFIHKEEEE